MTSRFAFLLIAAASAWACVPAEPAPVYYPPQPHPQPQPNPVPPPVGQTDPQPIPQPPPPPQQPVWDSRGWTYIGGSTAAGNRDRDVINIGRYSGRFDQLTLVVYDADLQLDHLAVQFDQGGGFGWNSGHYFRDGSRTRLIELSPEIRAIRRIELRYRNLGGTARVEIWGRDSGRPPPIVGTPPPPPPPPPPQPPEFDSRGWTLLAKKTVDGRRDRDAFKVSTYRGRFDQLTMVVYDSDLQLDDFVVQFGNKERWSPQLRHLFRNGSRSRSIDLPGDDRRIVRIEIAYRNIAGGGRARVEIYGRDTGRPPPTPPPPPKPPDFDPRGWTLVGSHTVDGRRDRDTIKVAKYQGRFDQLMMVVRDSDLELDAFVVVFGNQQRFSPQLQHVFRDGQRTRAIDLPGDDRRIVKIELAYRNVPGGGRARVEIYGRDTGKPRPTPPPPPKPPDFDSRGWTLLGSHVVDGRRDRDTIKVTRYQGRFDQLTMVVRDSDLQLEDFVVVFGNQERFSPQLKHVFRDGQRTRAIDLPGDDRRIVKIEVAYRNAPGGGRARVEIYGRDTGKPRPAPPPPRPPVFDSRGWTLLANQTVDGRRDRDVVKVAKYQGRFDQLTMVVLDNDLELADFVVVFGNGERFSPQLRHAFREGQRTRVIDLPGDDRRITKLELAYANRRPGARARVEIYGRDTGKPRPAPPPPKPPVFDSRGWTLLGKQAVDARRDRDVVRVGKYGGRFDQLTMVVLDSDLELADFVVVFGNGERFSPKLRHAFKEGSRTRAIDLPGDDRKIKTIELQYKNLPGGGKARVEIWGRDTGKPRPPKPPPAPTPTPPPSSTMPAPLPGPPGTPPAPPPPTSGFDSTGWNTFGRAIADGQRARETVASQDKQPYDEITFVVSGSPLELSDLTITFGNNDKFSPDTKLVFGGSTRARALEVPGSKARRIKSIEFSYGGLPGRGRATVDIYVRKRK